MYTRRQEKSGLLSLLSLFGPFFYSLTNFGILSHLPVLWAVPRAPRCFRAGRCRRWRHLPRVLNISHVVVIVPVKGTLNKNTGSAIRLKNCNLYCSAAAVLSPFLSYPLSPSLESPSLHLPRALGSAGWKLLSPYLKVCHVSFNLNFPLKLMSLCHHQYQKSEITFYTHQTTWDLQIS